MMQSSMDKLLKYLSKELILFIIGGLWYMRIEIMWRGFTHWSMGIVGGICFILIGLINEFYKWDLLFQWQCLIGATIITALEFVSGCIINLQLHWDVWDYSDRPFNLLGQICLWNSILWIALSVIAIIVDDFIRYKLFGEEFPHYSLTHKKK